MSSLKENKMGTMPIGRLLLTMALPMAPVHAGAGALQRGRQRLCREKFRTLIRAHQRRFAGLPGAEHHDRHRNGHGRRRQCPAVARLGERNADMVNRSALNGVFLAGLGMLLSALFGIFCAELFMRSQTSNEAVIAYGTAYIRIITIASFGIFGEIIFERLLQSTAAQSIPSSRRAPARS